jgi:hypothetical protein
MHTEAGVHITAAVDAASFRVAAGVIPAAAGEASTASWVPLMNPGGTREIPGSTFGIALAGFARMREATEATAVGVVLMTAAAASVVVKSMTDVTSFIVALGYNVTGLVKLLLLLWLEWVNRRFSGLKDQQCQASAGLTCYQ